MLIWDISILYRISSGCRLFFYWQYIHIFEPFQCTCFAEWNYVAGIPESYYKTTAGSAAQGCIPVLSIVYFLALLINWSKTRA